MGINKQNAHSKCQTCSELRAHFLPGERLEREKQREEKKQPKIEQYVRTYEHAHVKQ